MKRITRFGFPIAFLLVMFLTAIYYFYWKSSINQKGVYVLAVRTEVNPDGETGSSFKYQFRYREHSYKVSFVDPFFEFNSTDTLLYFKILPNNSSENFIPVKEIEVPNCFELHNAPESGWKEIPNDTCN